MKPTLFILDEALQRLHSSTNRGASRRCSSVSSPSRNVDARRRDRDLRPVTTDAPSSFKMHEGVGREMSPPRDPVAGIIQEFEAEVEDRLAKLLGPTRIGSSGSTSKKRRALIDHLNDKYLCRLLDPMERTPTVTTVRRYIVQRLDELSRMWEEAATDHGGIMQEEQDEEWGGAMERREREVPGKRRSRNELERSSRDKRGPARVMSDNSPVRLPTRRRSNAEEPQQRKELHADDEDETGDESSDPGPFPTGTSWRAVREGKRFLQEQMMSAPAGKVARSQTAYGQNKGQVAGTWWRGQQPVSIERASAAPRTAPGESTLKHQKSQGAQVQEEEEASGPSRDCDQKHEDQQHAAVNANEEVPESDSRSPIGNDTGHSRKAKPPVTEETAPTWVCGLCTRKNRAAQDRCVTCGRPQRYVPSRAVRTRNLIDDMAKKVRGIKVSEIQDDPTSTLGRFTKSFQKTSVDIDACENLSEEIQSVLQQVRCMQQGPEQGSAGSS